MTCAKHYNRTLNKMYKSNNNKHVVTPILIIKRAITASQMLFKHIKLTRQTMYTFQDRYSEDHSFVSLCAALQICRLDLEISQQCGQPSAPGRYPGQTGCVFWWWFSSITWTSTPKIQISKSIRLSMKMFNSIKKIIKRSNMNNFIWKLQMFKNLLDNKRAQGRSPEEKVKGHSWANNREP